MHLDKNSHLDSAFPTTDRWTRLRLLSQAQKNMMLGIESFYVVCLIGYCLSLYAIHVESSAEDDSNYVAYCDISSKVSCSKVFLSEYGRIFSHLGFIPHNSTLDLPNAFYGTIFYILAAINYYYSHRKAFAADILLSLTVLSMVLSAYLSYILTFILEDVCVVCYSTYVCNVLLFSLSWSNCRLKRERLKEN